MWEIVISSICEATHYILYWAKSTAPFLGNELKIMHKFDIKSWIPVATLIAWQKG